MKSRYGIGILAALVLPLTACGAEEENAPAPDGSAKPHVSAIAGSWFPSDPTALGRALDRFLAEADLPTTLSAANALAFVSPHAGYAFSGRTAAHVYRLVAARKPERVIVVGPSHHVSFRGVSIGDYDRYETPFGPATVDLETVAELRKCPLVRKVRGAHTREHSVDIQMPFLVRALGAKRFRVVPIVVGHMTQPDYRTVADAIKGVLDAKTVVIASSDFTHYGPGFRYMPFPLNDETRPRIEKLDMGAIDAIRDGGPPAFLEYKAKTGATICGYSPIALTLSLLPDDAEGVLLDYSLSGDRDGNYSRSVSYVSMAFTSESGRWPAPLSERKDAMAQPKAKDELSDAEKATLLRVARDTLEAYVREGKRPDLYGGDYEVTDRMKVVSGAFVTLEKEGALRGCIGHIVGRVPLIETVRENAVNAATRDFRFQAVKPEELDGIDVEVSVLSPLRAVESPQDIVLGKHGVLLKVGGAQAVYLPQVAPAQGWDLQQTLTSLSRKAGLPGDAWTKDQAVFEVFTAQVFGEKK